ncbi:MAG: SAM-dependent methyltransferase [Steroidobacter sp.]
MLHTTHTLPPLTADEQAHSERLTAFIRKECAGNNGWLGFDRFMELALYAPGLGYYSAGAHKLGAGGDFITAPEVSSLFSQCVANQCAEVLLSITSGDVLEPGAGSGIMAVDMLLHLEKLNALPERYFILEVSADLRQRQQRLLQQCIPHLFNRVTWLQSLPDNFCGCIIANEVLDALPVKRFVVINDVIHELGVVWRDNHFIWQPRQIDEALNSAVDHVSADIGHAFSEGYCSEINLLLPDWIRSLASILQRGVMIFLDYGLTRKQYYSAARNTGTLNCFYKHLQHDNPFANIGMQDITAWVDFTSLAEAGTQAGLELPGFTTQANFLLGAGIDKLLADEMHNNEISDARRWKLSQQVQQLMLPNGMGESFKVMAFSKNCDVNLSGFAANDLCHSL